MMAPTHVSLGLLAGASCASLAGLNPLPAALLGAIGGLLPDIDHPHSWLGRRLPILSWPLALLLGHRGVTHSLLAVFWCGTVIALAGWVPLALPVALGYLSHLAADYCTPSGVPLLWPKSNLYRAPITVKTGSLAEFVLAAFLFLLAFAVLAPRLL